MDEVQDIEDWYLFVNRLLRKNIHIIVTGSNAKLLSSELSTHLSGRSKEIYLYPFSFAEYCDMTGVDYHSNTTKAIGLRRAVFDNYIKQGGFPELMQISDSRSYIRDLTNNILQRDIEHRYKISYKAAFEQMAHHFVEYGTMYDCNHRIERVVSVQIRTYCQELSQLSETGLFAYRSEKIFH